LSVGGPIIDEDGKWGPKTLDAANSTYERGTVVDAFRNAREDYYEDIVAASPDKEKYLKAWIARAMK
jgi:lysozyme family protein